MKDTRLRDVEEEWKDIPEFKEFYQVSNKGRVRSLNRKYNRVRNGIKETVNVRERILKQNISPSGYYTVFLRKKKLCKTVPVHKLVAICFLGHHHNGNEYVVDHIDNNRLNNELSNLQVITQRENIVKDQKNFKGYSFHRPTGKYKSRIAKGNKVHFLGYFDTQKEAQEAYIQKEKELYGDSLLEKSGVYSTKKG